jgi:4,5-DOPA dioxygenase extradiol
LKNNLINQEKYDGPPYLKFKPDAGDFFGHDSPMNALQDNRYLPLLYVIGTRQDDEMTSIAVGGLEAGAISMLTAVVGNAGKTPVSAGLHSSNG